MIDDFGSLTDEERESMEKQLPGDFERELGNGICTSLMKNMIEYAREHQICRIDLVATDEGYPIYKKLGFEDKAQKYTDMRLKL